MHVHKSSVHWHTAEDDGRNNIIQSVHIYSSDVPAKGGPVAMVVP